VTVTGPGSTFNTGSIVFPVGSIGNGTLTIENGGTVNAPGSVRVASSSSSRSTLNIGAPTGSLPTAPGTLNTPSVTFGSGTGFIVFNQDDTSGNYHFAPPISSPGAVDVLGGTTVLTGAIPIRAARRSAAASCCSQVRARWVALRG
jgi:T5SS/PEP-CTERM-associated repeat protein